jgi:glycerol kinase
MILVIDVGTTSLRVAGVDESSNIHAFEQRPFAPLSPAPGLVEFDPRALADLVLDAANQVIGALGQVTAVGITTQRASTVVWDRSTGEPIGPGLGWQDLRTVGECIMARAEHGLALAPNQTATKAAWLLDNIDGARSRDLCIGTIDTWVARALSGGDLHVTDHTNAGMTGLYDIAAGTWSERVTGLLNVPIDALPDVIDSSGVLGVASALPGAPAIASLVGDQQASLVGQGCVTPGSAKITFGTGGMLDVCVGRDLPAAANRSANGTFPIVAWSHEGQRMWGVEAIMLSAGSNIDWLRDDLGLIATSADQSHDVAAACAQCRRCGLRACAARARHPATGTTALAGHAVRRNPRELDPPPTWCEQYLEGIAHRGADLVEAAEADTGLSIPSLRIDGGMSAEPDVRASGGRRVPECPVEVSRVVEATTLGAAYLAGVVHGPLERHRRHRSIVGHHVPSVDPNHSAAPRPRAVAVSGLIEPHGWIPRAFGAELLELHDRSPRPRKLWA